MSLKALYYGSCPVNHGAHREIYGLMVTLSLLEVPSVVSKLLGCCLKMILMQTLSKEKMFLVISDGKCKQLPNQPVVDTSNTCLR